MYPHSRVEIEAMPVEEGHTLLLVCECGTRQGGENPPHCVATILWVKKSLVDIM